MQRIILFIFCIALPALFSGVVAQNNDTSAVKKEKSKKGWSFGALPALAYDRDIGFKYGAVVNFYDYGDGTIYPVYRHSLFFECSFTTKGSGINQFLYDSKYLIPGIRVSSEISYLTERALDFYGFNGYESLYDSRFEDDEDTAYYISRQYYRYERKFLRLRSDFQGRFLSDKVRWVAGLSYYNIQIDTVDINRLNKNLNESDKLPNTEGGIYGDYMRWGIIPEDQADGGQNTLLAGGLIYDTRDNEPNPMRGIWSDVIVFWAPQFLGNGKYHFARIELTHRQYFTLIRDRLSFVARLAYHAKIGGNMPFYMLPFMYNAGNVITRDGLGGAKTLRGILRNRVVGEDYFYGNLEFRWKFIQTVVFKQNIYLALNVFSDFGMITGKYTIDTSGVPAEYATMFNKKDERLHISYGAGFHFALNQNFVTAVNYGFAVDKNDGDHGLYINLNWLF